MSVVAAPAGRHHPVTAAADDVGEGATDAGPDPVGGIGADGGEAEHPAVSSAAARAAAVRGRRVRVTVL
ncbi:hypothetical protein GCM10009739_28510 [Microbacterium ulmi]